MSCAASPSIQAFSLSAILFSGHATAQDAAAGERLFRTRCGSCHTVQPGQNRIGPSLAGVVGRQAGSVEGARYSQGMRDLGVTWDADQLATFLANPRVMVQGTTMTVSVPNQADRSNIVAYLQSLEHPPTERPLTRNLGASIMPTSTNAPGVDRRAVLLAGGVTLAGAAMPALAQTDQPPARPVDATEATPTAGRLMRAIPKTGEQMPAVGLGTFLTFDRIPGADRADLGEVLRRFVSAGGRVIDTSPLYGTAEVTVGQLFRRPIADDLFISNKVWATGGYLADDRQAEDSLNLSRERLWRERIDLMQCHSLVNVDVMAPLMRAWKKEWRIRYLGVTHYELPYFEALADWVEKGDLDFVQVHYSIATRDAERRIIPAAVDEGLASR